MNRTMPLSLAICALALAGCAFPEPPASDAAVPGVPAAGISAAGDAAPRFCVPPVQDPNGSTRRLDIGYDALGLREVPALSTTTGCDLMLQFGQHARDTEFRYEVNSAYSGEPLASGQVTNWTGVNSMVSKLMGTLRAQFAPGSEAHRAIALERRKASGVAERTPQYAPPERQWQIAQAAQAGDAALASGDKRKAFEAYRQVFEGGWSDDEVSAGTRLKFMRLVAAYPGLPPVPEEARKRMVRANAILKESRDFASYDEAATEMMGATSSAPWWTDAYFNLALVQEKQGYLADAISNLKLYLAGNPRAADARAVQDKIYALEVKQERAGRR